mmetsp:Transcript_53480/g.155930  ORF Transcript_53480/g.155930 Transcript_53480/m.155930 type:complete len:274 (+) Transcript_53480:440-1261(+)
MALRQLFSRLSSAAGPRRSCVWQRRCMASVQGSCRLLSSTATRRSSTCWVSAACGASGAAPPLLSGPACLASPAAWPILVRLCRKPCALAFTPSLCSSSSSGPSGSAPACAWAAWCTSTFSSPSKACTRTRWMSTPCSRRRPSPLLCSASSPSASRSLYSLSRTPSWLPASAAWPCSRSTLCRSSMRRKAGSWTQSSFESTDFVVPRDGGTGGVSSSGRGDSGGLVPSVAGTSRWPDTGAVWKRKLLRLFPCPRPCSAVRTGTVVTPKSSQRK